MITIAIIQLQEATEMQEVQNLQEQSKTQEAQIHKVEWLAKVIQGHQKAQEASRQGMFSVVSLKETQAQGNFHNKEAEIRKEMEMKETQGAEETEEVKLNSL